MPAGPVVSNNTPLVALWALGRLGLLRDLYGEVLIPPAVHSEFLATESEARQAALREAPWVKVRSLEKPRQALTYAGLDIGEAEVLALAEEVDARLVLLDERKARRFARRLERPLTGTVGVLLLAKELGALDKIAEPLSSLQRAGLYLSSGLLREALNLAGEDPGSDNV